MRRLRLLGLTSLVGLVVSVQPAGSVTTAVFHRPIVSIGAGQSSNWAGYNQGVLEGKGPFNAVSGDWIVPTATAHKKGTAEASSTWTGIGGGCVDAGNASCNVGDATLIQAGTEQDVDSSGHASYSAWWEVIPAPSSPAGGGIPPSSMTINPGDNMHVDIRQMAPEVWNITVQDLSRHESFTQTVPYTSDYSTAEWIEETPVVIDSNPGIAALPKLTTVHFSNATANNANPKLNTSEEIQLVDSNGAPLATPSAPNATTNGFNVCTYATSCPTPSSSTTTSSGSTRHTSKR